MASLLDPRTNVSASVHKKSLAIKGYYQAFFGVLIDLIIDLLCLIIKPFDNQTES